MKNLNAIRERYLRDALPVRLGGLAANLARVKSFSAHPDHRAVIESLLNESKFFIEWTALDADPKAQAELVELQVKLARWQHGIEEIWADPVQRMSLAEEAGVWSNRILDISGLLR
jgi:hypothetical protein